MLYLGPLTFSSHAVTFANLRRGKERAQLDAFLLGKYEKLKPDETLKYTPKGLLRDVGLSERFAATATNALRAISKFTKGRIRGYTKREYAVEFQVSDIGRKFINYLKDRLDNLRKREKLKFTATELAQTVLNRKAITGKERSAAKTALENIKKQSRGRISGYSLQEYSRKKLISPVRLAARRFLEKLDETREFRFQPALLAQRLLGRKPNYVEINAVAQELLLFKEKTTCHA